MNDMLDCIAAVVDEDNGRSEAMANYGAQFLNAEIYVSTDSNHQSTSKEQKHSLGLCCRK